MWVTPMLFLAARFGFAHPDVEAKWRGVGGGEGEP